MNTSGIPSTWIATITSASKIYIAAMIGIIHSATHATERMPPKKIGAQISAKAMPVTTVGMPKLSPSTSAMVSAWTALNASPKVKISSTANTMPQPREPSPRWM